MSTALRMPAPDEAALDPDAMRQPLADAWYCVGRSETLKAGRLLAVELNGEQIVLGREASGAPFALRDRCPHRGMALSKGRFDGGELTCPFHGWRFGTDGRCRDVPTLSASDTADFSRIAVQRFPIRESAGFAWVNPYLGAPTGSEPAVLPELGFEAAGRVVVELVVEASFDLTTLSLVDPGHVAFVHNSWWFRPSKDLRGQKRVANYTFATPMTQNRTLLTNALYWNMPALNLLKPIARPLMRQFLTQDQQVLQHAQAGLDRKPTMVLFGQGDLPSQWYFRLKREALQAAREGRPFANPLAQQELRWRS
jgi:nitrite reductase/ring-hydroxylating ferredoxin subunit